MIPRVLLLGLAALLAGVGGAHAADLRAGAAKIAITPAADEFPYTAPGEKPYVGVHDPVFARALVLDDGAHRAVIVSLEVTAVPDPAELTKAVALAAKVPASGVFVVATHTHNVPLASNHGMQRDAVMTREIARVKQGAAEAARQAAAHLQPARLLTARGQAFVNINNGEQAGLTEWNDPAGPSDKTLDLVKVEGSDGKPLALLVNYASHAEVMFRSATRNNGYEVSGDLPGAVSRLLEQNPHGAPVVLYSPSAEADQLPLFKSLQPAGNLPATDEGAAGWGLLDLLARRLTSSVLDTVATLHPLAGAPRIETATGSVSCPGQQLSRDPKTGKITAEDKPPVVIPLSVIRMDGLALVGIGGDVASDIGRKVKAASPAPQTIVNTMLAGSAGYIFSDASYKHPGHGLLLSPLKAGCAEGAIVRGVSGLLKTDAR